MPKSVVRASTPARHPSAALASLGGVGALQTVDFAVFQLEGVAVDCPYSLRLPAQ